MASGKEYLHFILEQLSTLDDISYRSMMGEYILYYHGKIVGGIYDDRLLVKKTKSALECIEKCRTKGFGALSQQAFCNAKSVFV